MLKFPQISLIGPICTSAYNLSTPFKLQIAHPQTHLLLKKPCNLYSPVCLFRQSLEPKQKKPVIEVLGVDNSTHNKKASAMQRERKELNR